MPYTADINRSRPGAFLFLIDQSGSMDEVLEVTGSPRRLEQPEVIDGIRYTHSADGITKAECVADLINKTIGDLVTQCTRHDGCRHYFDVGVIGYRSRHVGSALRGPLSERLLQPLPMFEERTLRIEERQTRGGKGPVERFPVWIEDEAEGDTPMCRALEMAADAVAAWCSRNPLSHPPIVINVTDGQSSDGDPEIPAARLRHIGTEDGATLLFNLFLEPSKADPILYPTREQDLPDKHARTLFRMSSPFPDKMRLFARERGCKIAPGARMFGYKAGVAALIKCFELATRAAQVR
jgi:hypothetical protein